MKLAVVNGPNLNMLEYREKDLYGDLSYDQLLDLIDQEISKYPEIQMWESYQSNSEGELVDFIQGIVIDQFDAIIINPAAYSHYSIAILDALLMFKGIKVEVHLSDVMFREDYRKVLLTKQACDHFIYGQGVDSYLKAVQYIVEEYKSK